MHTGAQWPQTRLKCPDGKLICRRANRYRAHVARETLAEPRFTRILPNARDNKGDVQ